MTRKKLEKLTKEAVMSELSQNFLDGKEVLEFYEVLNVVQAVVKKCSTPDVRLWLPSEKEIEQEAKNYEGLTASGEKWNPASTFKDGGLFVIHYIENSTKGKEALRAPNAVGRSEQLKAFLLFIQENAPNYRTKQLKPEQVIKAYLESL